MYNGHNVTTAADGKFTMTGMRPGYYRARATFSAGKTRLQSAPFEFHVESSDPPPLQLALAPAEELIGTLAFSGESPAGSPAAKPTVYLSSNDISGSIGGPDAVAEIGKDNTFRVAGLASDKFRVHVDNLPDNAYVKSISLDGQAIDDGIVDFSGGIKGARLKVVVGQDGGQISGKVLGHDGQPLVSPLAMLMIWKDPKQKEPDNEKISNGQFAIKSLKPGKYRLLAIDISDVLGGGFDNEEQMSELVKSLAEEVEVKEGDRVTKDLKVVDKEKLSAKK
jgi:hypothetical protein